MTRVGEGKASGWVALEQTGVPVNVRKENQQENKKEQEPGGEREKVGW